MKRNARSPLPLLLLAGTVTTGCALGQPQQQGPSPEQRRMAALSSRVDTLEQRVQNADRVQLLDRIEQLERENRALRGEVERLAHEVETQNRRQRDQYVDLDQRLRSVETGAPAPAVASTVATVAGPAASSNRPRPGVKADPVSERAAYQVAFELLKEGRYEQAITGFRQFLADYPRSQYADNAQYWLGEAYYVTRSFQTAAQEFAKVIDLYPDSGKRQDALLKLGYVHYELKDWKRSRARLNEVVKSFPGSTAANLAEQRLRRMQREGR